MAWLDATFLGFVSGLCLLVSVGPQTLYVLRHAISGRHVVPVCVTIIVSDALLLVAGTTGLNGVMSRIPQSEALLTMGGAAFVLVCGLSALSRTIQPQAALAIAGGGALSVRDDDPGLRATLLGALAVTFLNPLVYVDAIVVLGNLATASGNPASFVLGAIAASCCTVTGLGVGARALRPILDTPRGAMGLDGVSGTLMIGMGIVLWSTLP